MIGKKKCSIRTKYIYKLCIFCQQKLLWKCLSGEFYSFYVSMLILAEDLDLFGHTAQSRWYINILILVIHFLYIYNVPKISKSLMQLRVPFMEFVLMRSWAFSGGVTVPVEGNCRVFAFGVLASQTPMWLTSQLSRGDLWCIIFCLLFKTMYANFWRCFVCLPMKKISIVSQV